MTISSRTPEGIPNDCPVCGHSVRIEPSIPPWDAPCPSCGSLLWFAHAVLDDGAEVFAQDAIMPDLSARNKPDAVREIVAQLSSVQAIESEYEEEIIEDILKREEMGSTGIGYSVAVPHARHASVDRMVGAMALSPVGLDFSSLDHRPVHTIFLLVSPMARPTDHLHALQCISRYLRTNAAGR